MKLKWLKCRTSTGIELYRTWVNNDRTVLRVMRGSDGLWRDGHGNAFDTVDEAIASKEKMYLMQLAESRL